VSGQDDRFQPGAAPEKHFSRPLAAVLVVAVLLLALVAWVFWLVVQRPMTVERWATVAALKGAGLERATLDTTAGELAVWRGGPTGGGDPAATAPTLVLLHGAGDHAGSWSAVAEALAPDHRLVIPDLPGHGDSEPGEGGLPMATVLGGVVDLLRAESAATDGPAPVLVGNSLGGWLALLVGHAHPELISRLVVVNGGAIPGPQDPDLLLPEDRDQARRILDLVGAPGPLPDGVLDDLVRNLQSGALPRFMAADDHDDHDLTGRLGEVAVPVDLVWGELDRYLPLDYARAHLEALPAARLTVIEECGHVPLRYCPKRFIPLLRQVLASPPPAPGDSTAATEGATAAAPEGDATP